LACGANPHAVVNSFILVGDHLIEKNFRFAVDGWLYTCKVVDVPSKRAKGKKQIAVWLTPEEKAVLQQLAKERGISMTEVLKEKIYEHNKKQK
jgi:hypothetical protein